MLTVLVGESGAGKDYIGKQLHDNYGFKEIVTYTTRDPRPGEQDGINYNFISKEDFLKWKEYGFFLETDEYSNDRFYGTSKESIKTAINSPENFYVIVNTVGLHKIQKEFGEDNFASIYITAPLGTRVKRYIDRLGVHNFSFSDMDEIYARVNRDFGMFKGIEDEVDMTLNNNGSSTLTKSLDAIAEYCAIKTNKENDYDRL